MNMSNDALVQRIADAVNAALFDGMAGNGSRDKLAGAIRSALAAGGAQEAVALTDEQITRIVSGAVSNPEDVDGDVARMLEDLRLGDAEAISIMAGIRGVIEADRKLRPSAPIAAQEAASVETLAKAIRRVDGRHSLGAAALAEAILTELPLVTGRKNAAPSAPIAAREAVAWSRYPGDILDDNGVPIGSDEMEVVWGRERPAYGEDWAPLYSSAPAHGYFDPATAQLPPTGSALQKLGEYLSTLLDEDRWATAEQYLFAAAAEAAPSAPLSLPAEREGWRLVPVTPTQAMLNAAGFFDDDTINTRDGDEFAREVYRDMLAAAPTPPESSGDDCKCNAEEQRLCNFQRRTYAVHPRCRNECPTAPAPSEGEKG